MMLVLSRHFRENWEKRVGGDAKLVEVQKALREGVLVQRGRHYRQPDGRPHRTLSIFLYRGVVYTIDEFKGVAVSVFTDKLSNPCFRDELRGREGALRLRSGPDGP